MTPIERIRQNREMLQLSEQIARPKMVAQPFPRNATGLALVSFMIMPLIYKAVVDPSVTNILGYGLSSAVMGLGVFSLSVGQRKTAIYDGKFVAKASVIPFKAIGAGLIGLAAAALTNFQGGSLAQAAAVFPVVSALSLLTFGMDPLSNKGLNTTDERHVYKLEKIAAQAGAQIDRLKKHASPLAVPEVMDGIARFERAVDKLLSVVTDDPARANAVRKFFTIYLNGVSDAATRFAAVYRSNGCRETKDDFVELLTRFSAAFESKAADYASAGSEMLEVEMKVLDDYLAREGMAA